MVSNRRMILTGLLALLAAGITRGIATAEPTFCINPWRQAKTKDATVRPSEIKAAALIIVGWDRGRLWDWFEVKTHDGRHIQTECAHSQPNFLALAHAVEAAGVPVYRFNFVFPDVLDRALLKKYGV